MGDAGIFAPGERVELIEGEIIPVSPQNPLHAKIVERLTTLLVMNFGKTHGIRVQLPLTLTGHSEPEPGFALVSLAHERSGPRHPASADLVIEVADSSLSFDRGEKASLYAKVGIPDYWIVNARNRRVEIRRDPAECIDAVYGWEYTTLNILAPSQKVSPLFSPEVILEISDLLD